MKKLLLIVLLAMSMAVSAETTPPGAPGPEADVLQGPQIEPEPPRVIDVLYVTDKLILGLKDNPEGNGKSIKLLRSGMKLDILEKRGAFNQVRTTDGMIGWAKSTFMVKDKPAVLLVDELSKENASLKKEITVLKNGAPVVSQIQVQDDSLDEEKITAPLRQRIIELEQMLGEAQKQIDEAGEQQVLATGDVQPVSSAMDMSQTLVIAAVLLLVGLVSGFAIAFYLFEQRVKRRFAGLKV
jgi:SH3 domain protein